MELVNVIMVALGNSSDALQSEDVCALVDLCTTVPITRKDAMLCQRFPLLFQV